MPPGRFSTPTRSERDSIVLCFNMAAVSSIVRTELKTCPTRKYGFG